MPDREKVIKDIEECLSASCRGFRPRKLCPYNDDEWDIMRDTVALLKEQNDCENCAIAIEDRQPIVRCKDCKYWYFAENRIPCEQENVCGRHGIVVTPDWFCAEGEVKKDT